MTGWTTTLGTVTIGPRDAQVTVPVRVCTRDGEPGSVITIMGRDLTDREWHEAFRKACNPTTFHVDTIRPGHPSEWSASAGRVTR